MNQLEELLIEKVKREFDIKDGDADIDNNQSYDEQKGTPMDIKPQQHVEMAIRAVLKRCTFIDKRALALEQQLQTLPASTTTATTTLERSTSDKRVSKTNSAASASNSSHTLLNRRSESATNLRIRSATLKPPSSNERPSIPFAIADSISAGGIVAQSASSASTATILSQQTPVTIATAAVAAVATSAASTAAATTTAQQQNSPAASVAKLQITGSGLQTATVGQPAYFVLRFVLAIISINKLWYALRVKLYFNNAHS